MASNEDILQELSDAQRGSTEVEAPAAEPEEEPKAPRRRAAKKDDESPAQES